MYVPAVVGVPESTPPASERNAGGSCPVFAANVYGGVPPTIVSESVQFAAFPVTAESAPVFCANATGPVVSVTKYRCPPSVIEPPWPISAVGSAAEPAFTTTFAPTVKVPCPAPYPPPMPAAPSPPVAVTVPP